MRLRPGLRPRPSWGSLQRSSRPLAVLRGPTSKGMGRERGGELWGRGGMPHLCRRGDKRPWGCDADAAVIPDVTNSRQLLRLNWRRLRRPLSSRAAVAADGQRFKGLWRRCTSYCRHRVSIAWAIVLTLLSSQSFVVFALVCVLTEATDDCYTVHVRFLVVSVLRAILPRLLLLHHKTRKQFQGRRACTRSEDACSYVFSVAG